MFILKDADFDLAVFHVPDALHEEAPLQAEGSQEQVDAHAAEAVSLEEGHQEAEADEDHDVDILKHWRCERGGQFTAYWTTGSCFVARAPLEPWLNVDVKLNQINETLPSIRN